MKKEIEDSNPVLKKEMSFKELISTFKPLGATDAFSLISVMRKKCRGPIMVAENGRSYNLTYFLNEINLEAGGSEEEMTNRAFKTYEDDLLSVILSTNAEKDGSKAHFILHIKDLVNLSSVKAEFDFDKGVEIYHCLTDKA